MPKFTEWLSNPLLQSGQQAANSGGGGGIWEMLFGSKGKNVSTLTPGQGQGLDQILQQLKQMGGQGGAYSGAQNHLSSLLSGDPNAFSQFEAPYRQQFESQTLPGIAERFAGMGGGMGGGALSSSGFGQALGGAGAQLQSQLAGLHGGLKNQAAGQAMGQYNQLANQGLGTQAQAYQPGTPGAIQELIKLLPFLFM